MIVSASRRTDIPCWYAEWFMNRVAAGYAMTRNPMNSRQIRRVSLLPGDADCFVFWTKDPGRAKAGGQSFLDTLPVLDESGYIYYFQFTLTPYGPEIERGQRGKADIARDFARLSGHIGKERVIWRYDPIILNADYGLTSGWHAAAFAGMCEKLRRYTEAVVISFADVYAKLRTDLVRETPPEEMMDLAARMGEIARKYGLRVRACCERTDFSVVGIEKAACVDRELVEKIAGRPLELKPDRNQRQSCGCAESVDIGAYNTCPGGCVYCYANHSPASIAKNIARYRAEGEFLLG